MTLNIQPDEQELLRLRKHWFVLLKEKAGALTAGVLPIVLFAIGSSFGVFPAELIAAPAAWLFVASLWLLIMLMTLATIWTNYYLDIWIVTDRRIINIDQIGLFRREVTTTRMERVQDITVAQHGIIETLLNFGSLQVQTASEDASDMLIKGIPRPSEIRNIITDQVDKCTERHMHETSQNDGRVSHDVHEE